MALTSGWQMRLGDSPFDSAGVPLWTESDTPADAWKSTMVLHRPPGSDSTHFFWLRVRLPRRDWSSPALYVPYVHLSFEAYVDSVRIYRSGELTPSSQNRFVAFNWHLIPLQKSDLGKMLYLRIFSDHSRFFGVHRQNDQVTVGAQKDLINQLIKANIDSVFLGTIFVFIGLFALFMFFLRLPRGKYILLHFGFLATSIGLFYVIGNRTTQLYVGNPLLRYYLGHIAFTFFPVGLYTFFEDILPEAYKKIVRWFWVVHLLAAAAMFILDVTHLVFYPIALDYFLWLFMLTIILSFVISIRSALGGSREAKIVVAGFVIFGLFGLNDILSGLQLLPYSAFVSHWGTLIFVLSLGYIVEKRFARDQERIEAYSRDLELISSNLRTSKAQLEEYSKTLEHKVAERTHDLQRKNEELQQTLQELKKTQEQLILNEKMVSLGNLVAGVAHEVNNPIGAVNSSADVSKRCIANLKKTLAESTSLDELTHDAKFQKSLKLLEDNNEVTSLAGQRIAKIVRSLKNFARLDEAEYQKANIHEGLDNTLTLIHHKIKNRIQVVKDYRPIPEIDCYPNQLNQVFMNILVNAADAIPDKGTITISTYVENDQVVVKISDDGKGIAPEHLDKIFSPGFTTKGVGVGTGLGLSISYNIIQKHHGKITVESEVGKGTTFTIYLPVEGKPRNSETSNAT